MTRTQRIWLVLACTVAGIACRGETVVEPPPVAGQPSPAPPSAPPPAPPLAPPPAPSAVFASLGITPDTAAMAPGEALPLLVRALDQNGRQVDILKVEWSSSATDVATVTSSGEVRGVAPGAAVIRARVTVGQVTGSAGMAVRILPVPALTSVVLASGPQGWQPSAAYLQTGGSVEWTSGPVSWAEAPVTWIWLMDINYRVVDSVDVRSGSATRRFQEPGVINYCSGGCWDPPDYGTIFVQ